MLVECTHHIDASEPDERGTYEYYYEYDLYRFVEGENCFVARSYTDDPEKAHFLQAEATGQPRQLVDADLKQPLFVASLAYLRASGKLKLNWLSGRGNGYEPVPSTVESGA
jgi:hypothetical protein